MVDHLSLGGLHEAVEVAHPIKHLLPDTADHGLAERAWKFSSVRLISTASPSFSSIGMFGDRIERSHSPQMALI
jgi:hypothetical protein